MLMKATSHLMHLFFKFLELWSYFLVGLYSQLAILWIMDSNFLLVIVKLTFFIKQEVSFKSAAMLAVLLLLVRVLP